LVGLPLALGDPVTPHSTHTHISAARRRSDPIRAAAAAALLLKD